MAELQPPWSPFLCQHTAGRPPLTLTVHPPVSGQTVTLKNISTDTSGFYICTSSNEMGQESCNITVAARLRKHPLG